MRKLLFSSLAAALAATTLAWTTPPAAAARANDAVVAMTGVIQPGAYEAFHTVVKRARPNLVVVSGPGGDLGTALRIASEVRRRGFDTAIPQGEYCASACVVIFLSGRTKYIAKGAKLGLHSASNLDGSHSREGTAIMGRYLSQVGVPRSVISRMEQRRGNDMYWLGDSDKRALRIVAMGAAPKGAAKPARATAGKRRAAATRVAQREAGPNYRMLPNGVIMKVR